MKIYVSVDMEGIGGIVLEEQIFRDRPMYEEARRLLTAEVNAVVEALLASGVEHICVKDAHGSGFNFVPEELHPAADYAMGHLPLGERFGGLDASFDGALLIGYHAMAGEPRAVLDHTYSYRDVLGMELNGRPVGEIAVDALLFGLHGVPVLLVTGDDAACREAKRELGEVTVYETKRAVTRHSAVVKPPKRVRHEIREAVRQAIRERARCRPHRLPGPYELKMGYVHTALADRKHCDGERTMRLDGRHVLFRDDELVRLLTRAF